MATVLVVRKPDRTIHKVPIENKAKIMGYNNRLPRRDQWNIEEMDEEEADKLPFHDANYVTSGDAQTKIKQKDDQIKELEARLALLTAGDNTAEKPTSNKTVKDAADKTAASSK
ncbi:MAG: hypothetical protein ABI237_05970 [Ginsengibacter sp.]